MLTMRVLRLVVHARSRQPVLVLREAEGDRCLPVFLRQPHADVIAVGPRGPEDPLLPQDVLVPILDGGTRVEVLPSDALAIAVRESLPIGVADEVLDAVGQPVEEIFPDGTDAPPEKQMDEFRSFLDDVSPEDFGRPG